MKLLTLNVRGLQNKIKQKRGATHIKKLVPDIILLQETHVRNDTDLILDQKMYSFQFHAVGTSKARGVSLLFKKTSHFQLQEMFRMTRADISLLREY